MPFLKKTIVWVIFLAAMYFGGVGTQSSSNFFQGMGFFSMVAALACLYIIFKLIWGPLGTMSRLLLVGGVVVYIAFSIGLFNGNTLESFLSGIPHPQTYGLGENEDQTAEINALEIQMFGGEAEKNADVSAPTAQSEPTERGNQPQMIVHKGNTSHSSGNILNTIKSWFSSGNQTPQSSSKVLNPMDYPEMYGHPQVVSGSILVLNGVRIKLFGIEAPEPTQTCENRYGNSYHCGKAAIIWMRDWLNKKNVSCRILSRIENNNTTGICFSDDGKYDVAAKIVYAGWAVAYTKHTRVYVDYEREAAEARRGLWSGRFYKPWDWRRLQNRKINIKIEQKSKGFNFKGLF